MPGRAAKPDVAGHDEREDQCRGASAIAAARRGRRESISHPKPSSRAQRAYSCGRSSAAKITTPLSRGDDQYLLAHICIAAARKGNLAANVFLRSIVPQLEASAAFAQSLQPDPAGGPNAIPVDSDRLDGFFDALACAVYFDRFGEVFDPSTHRLRHVYPGLVHDTSEATAGALRMREGFARFFDRYEAMAERFEADKVDEVVYANTIMAPAGIRASITIAHVFYGVFEVISLMTYSPLQLMMRAAEAG